MFNLIILEIIGIFYMVADKAFPDIH